MKHWLYSLADIRMMEKLLLKVPEGTVSVKNREYSGRNDLTEVVLPGSIQELGVGAFADCRSLEKINLPSGLKQIKKELFSGCSSLREIEIPPGVEAINEWAFRGCSSLETVVIPESVTSIAEEAFLSCPDIRVLAAAGSYAYQFADAHRITVVRQ